MLECQVALKDFCAALYFKCPYLTKKVCDKESEALDITVPQCDEVIFLLHTEKGHIFLPH